MGVVWLSDGAVSMGCGRDRRGGKTGVRGRERGGGEEGGGFKRSEGGMARLPGALSVRLWSISALSST